MNQQSLLINYFPTETLPPQSRSSLVGLSCLLYVCFMHEKQANPNSRVILGWTHCDRWNLVLVHDIRKPVILRDMKPTTEHVSGCQHCFQSPEQLHNKSLAHHSWLFLVCWLGFCMYMWGREAGWYHTLSFLKSLSFAVNGKWLTYLETNTTCSSYSWRKSRAEGAAALCVHVLYTDMFRNHL